MKWRHIKCWCPLTGKAGIRMQPKPHEPQSSVCIKVKFEGEPFARWVALEQLEVVRG